GKTVSWKTDLTRRTAKRESDYRRNKTRVNIGEAFQRWRELRKCLGLSLDSELAVLLLDSRSPPVNSVSRLSFML
uniref:Uncharacterized protein n=1 Tax=Dicentrarchus labrax TaxID=13489 RepID=A0A8C4HQN8_DICLA